MEMIFKEATSNDAEIIGSLVIRLTQEICQRTDAQHFDIDLNDTVARCRELLSSGHYAAIIGYANAQPVAVSTITETYALYAGGKVGVIQEFYVVPALRSAGVGTKLIEHVRQYGLKHNWSCIELCTPPLPEFERTLNFYQDNGLKPVGGRKMRENLTKC